MRQETGGEPKKFYEVLVEKMHEFKEKDVLRRARKDAPPKEKRGLYSETNFKLMMKRDDVIQKTGRYAVDANPNRQQEQLSTRPLNENLLC